MNKEHKTSSFKAENYPQLSKYLIENNLTELEFNFILVEEKAKYDIWDKKYILNSTIAFDLFYKKEIIDYIVETEPNCTPHLMTHTLYLDGGYFRIGSIPIANLNTYNSNTLLNLLEQLSASLFLVKDNPRGSISSETETKLALNLLSFKELNDLIANEILNANQWNLIANSYRYQEKYDLAEAAYLKAIELDPKNEEPYGNLLSLYILTENFANYEDIYSDGMRNASPKNFIVYQDGRYQYQTGDYDMAYSAALSVLTAKQMQDEGAWILGVLSSFNMAREAENDEKKLEFYNQANDMLEKGLIVYPESAELIRLKSKYFED